jgi:uncharacterized linocin/CFP29 family protein
MDPAVANLGWTEDQWNRIGSAVAEEAQRARVVAQALPVVGLDDPSVIAIPKYQLAGTEAEPYPFPSGATAKRLTVDSKPTLYITTLSINVSLRSQEVSDPQLSAALGMFRRGANHIARMEDALFFKGRTGTAINGAPPAIAALVRATGDNDAEGIFPSPLPAPNTPANGDALFQSIVNAIGDLENSGQTGPFACLLSHNLFNLICSPNSALVTPRDRILPFLQGPLLRSSQVPADRGCVIALGGSPVEVIVASDINVRYLQTTPEPRYVFRVSERIALRIKEPESIAFLG